MKKLIVIRSSLNSSISIKLRGAYSMKTIQTIMVVVAILSIPIVMGTQHAMAGTTGTTGTVTITEVCELIVPGTLAFSSGDPVNNGPGVGVGETSAFVLSNANGNIFSDVDVSGSNWYAQGGTPPASDVMDVTNTKYSTTSGLIGTKTALTSSAAGLTVIPPGTTANTFWDLEIDLDIDLAFTGIAVEDITFEFACITVG